MLNTRFNLMAQLITLRLSAGVLSGCLDRLPRLTGVTPNRKLLLDRPGAPAKTPWNRVRFTLGFDVSGTSKDGCLWAFCGHRLCLVVLCGDKLATGVPVNH